MDQSNAPEPPCDPEPICLGLGLILLLNFVLLFFFFAILTLFLVNYTLVCLKMHDKIPKNFLCAFDAFLDIFVNVLHVKN
jgi:hypothetical protein